MPLETQTVERGVPGPRVPGWLDGSLRSVTRDHDIKPTSSIRLTEGPYSLYERDRRREAGSIELEDGILVTHVNLFLESF